MLRIYNALQVSKLLIYRDINIDDVSDPLITAPLACMHSTKPIIIM